MNFVCHLETGYQSQFYSGRGAKRFLCILNIDSLDNAIALKYRLINALVILVRKKNVSTLQSAFHMDSQDSRPHQSLKLFNRLLISIQVNQ